MFPEQFHPYLGRLKAIHLFNGLNDPQIIEVAGMLEPEAHPAGEAIVREGEPGEFFYIIDNGQVKVTRKQRETETQVAVLEPGDYFGEQALTRGRPRNATVTAITEVELLRLSRDGFDTLLKRYPQIKLNLGVTRQSRELQLRHKFDWLEPSEVIYLVTRRDRNVLYGRLLWPLLGAALLLAALGGLAYSRFWLGLWLWLPLALADAAFFAWQYVDWSNDFYIVTNQRVIWLEKIIGLYDSRQEAPLRTVLSVTVKSDQVGRWLGYGDVLVRTFTGLITFDTVPHPAQMAALVEEHWTRTRRSTRRSEQEAMKNAIRSRIGLATRPEPPPPAPQPRPAPGGLKKLLGNLFLMRFESGNVVTYRKHWFVLTVAIWRPSAFLLLLAGLLGLRLGGVLGQVGLLGICMGLGVLSLPLVGWWLYEYVDWRNDIYQVTPDQIVDLSRKPLSREERKAAPLENVLSTTYEREGVLGPLLNFGNVVAKVGVTEFRFDGVFDPVGVQQDIYRRIEASRARKAQAEAAKRREEIAEWLGAYHSVVNEPPPPPSPPPPEPAPVETEEEAGPQFETPDWTDWIDYGEP